MQHTHVLEALLLLLIPYREIPYPSEDRFSVYVAVGSGDTRFTLYLFTVEGSVRSIWIGDAGDIEWTGTWCSSDYGNSHTKEVYEECDGYKHPPINWIKLSNGILSNGEYFLYPVK